MNVTFKAYKMVQVHSTLQQLYKRCKSLDNTLSVRYLDTNISILDTKEKIFDILGKQD